MTTDSIGAVFVTMHTRETMSIMKKGGGSIIQIASNG